MYVLMNCKIYIGNDVFVKYVVIINGDKIEVVCFIEFFLFEMNVVDLNGVNFSFGFIDL